MTGGSRVKGQGAKLFALCVLTLGLLACTRTPPTLPSPLRLDPLSQLKQDITAALALYKDIVQKHPEAKREGDCQDRALECKLICVLARYDRS